MYDLHIVSEALSARGHVVYALDTGTQDCQPDPSGVVTRLGMASSPVQLMSPRLPVLRPLPRSLQLVGRTALWFATTRLRRAWLEYAIGKVIPDVILLYSGVRLGPDCVRIAKRNGIPVVFRNVDKLHNLFGSRFRRAVARHRERRTYPHVQRILALTPNYRDYMIDLGATESRVSVVPFPLNVKTFSPTPKPQHLGQTPSLDGLRAGRVVRTLIQPTSARAAEDLNIPSSFGQCPVIVFVGTFYEFGGLLDLVNAVQEELIRSRPFRLLLVGDGPLRPQLEEAISRLGLGDVIHITGYQPFELMPDYIRQARVCVNVFPINKQTRDIFSAKIVQYLACGKPVVSTRLPGIERALNSAQTGVIYCDTTSEVLSTALKVAEDERWSAELSSRGRAYVERVHAVDAVTDAVEQALSAVQAEKGNGHEPRR